METASGTGCRHAILRHRVGLIQPFRDAIYEEEGTTSSSSMRFPKGSWTKILLYPSNGTSSEIEYPALRKVEVSPGRSSTRNAGWAFRAGTKFFSTPR